MLLMGFGITWTMSQLLKDVDPADTAHPRSRIITTQVAAVAAALEHSGESAAEMVLQNLQGRSPFDILVVDGQGHELLGRPVSNLPRQDKTEQSPGRGLAIREVTSPSGGKYTVSAHRSSRIPGLGPLLKAPFLAGPPAPRHKDRAPPFAGRKALSRSPKLFWSRIGMALLISGVVCFWLAWYLTRPVKRLRDASRRLSKGELDVRVGPAMGGRRDEISDLGSEFDQMAEKLQSLLTAQRQLLNDVSHELRSPLSRLQVAVGLARRRSGDGDTPELNRIEKETERLNELVAQVLTLSRLEAGTMDYQDDFVDIAALQETIVRDADFEAKQKNCRVELGEIASGTVRGNGELLHRAVENVVRNAVKYTENGTNVEVTGGGETEQEGWARIKVCDRGPGVPLSLLERLFDPFIRVTEARDRDSGGFGLGLAIAKHAIQLHGGEISAYNRQNGGLCVEITIPVQK